MASPRLLNTIARAAQRPGTRSTSPIALILRHGQAGLTGQQQRRSNSTTTTATTQRAPSTTCPTCKAPLSNAVTPVCSTCSALLPPPPLSTSSFDLFDVPQQYSIDTALLKRRFLQFQQKVHPDLFSGQGDKEQWARVWSAKVNDAYKVLAEGRSRGEYLLTLSGVDIAEADGVTDPELLMEIMETREALEDAETEQDVASIRETNQANMKAAFEQLATVFDNGSPNLDEAKTLLIKLKYYENIDGVCREWQPGKRIELQH
ncbi:molecular chaperone [Microbotryomycetes sp. JL201]|nr:molecular chaperone [Microbotryomycetes sp. JL201]